MTKKTVTEFREYRANEAFRYEMPDDIDAEMLLLTNRREVITGHWEGGYGQRFIAWFPMPSRDSVREKELIKTGVIKHAIK